MKARILEPSLENISLAAEALRRGEVVGVPSETVYGLAGNARSSEALASIFEVKERPTFDPLIVHVPLQAKSLSALDEMGIVETCHLNEKQKIWAAALIEKFWPGPLTLVLPKKTEIPDLATSGLPSVAVRMPKHPVFQALLEKSGTPLAAPSANRFGHTSPTTAQAVASELGERIGFILDGGPCEVGVESTILDLTQPEEVRVLRFGGVTVEEIRKTIPNVITEKPETTKPLAPGMIDRHYAPQKPFFLLPEAISRPTLDRQLKADLWQKIRNLPQDSEIGLLLVSGDPVLGAELFGQVLQRPVRAISLSPKGDLHEVAQKLFATIRTMDEDPRISVLFSEPCLESRGLGPAIADRLQRAAVAAQ